MLPKPSLVLQVKLLPEDYSEAQAAEIKRSYMYLAQSVVSELPEDERAEGNLMRLNVRLMKPYWNPADDGAQKLWGESFMPWLANATRNMSTAMHNFNTVPHPLGSGNVTYEWADFDFAPNAVLRVKMDDENRIPSAAPAFCDAVRSLCAEGVLGEDVVRVRIPSLASLEAQKAAYEEELRQFRAARAAEAAVACAPAADTDPEAGTAVDAAEFEAPADADSAAEAVDAAADQNNAAGTDEVAVDEAEPAPAADDAATTASEPVFTIDYAIWGIERADGTVVELDSRTL
ncbi:hypothetical protein VJ923_07645 [Adlercreutzia sp. R25]|uniref:Uncharacterized protein n=1 Tax=Adlercreutzia shanghongiae TaxID=3111773 RepID=A0ABU6IZ77_9ACTN|nr:MULTISPECIES: hypothetical protein [unclassified Adlercreutzia]MEC4273028.1 hypothetical protein [Adlercreutzia sp. R25]MEC4295181.1 hypothetical protein [Adlercreutzia sp. R22]